MQVCDLQNCNAAAPHMCSRCNSAHYCSAEHQRAAWPAHKLTCKRIAAAKDRLDTIATAGIAAPQDRATASTAGSLLAQKAAFIASHLGLDPSLPLSELLAAASKATGMAMNHSKQELQEADGLITAAQSGDHGKVQAPAAAGRQQKPSGGKKKKKDAAASAAAAASSTTCRSCGKAAAQICRANGCCARCIYEVGHFMHVGNAMSKSDETELASSGGAHAHTYGEMTRLGFRQLARRVELSPKDVFVDCGSGTGRLVLQAATEYGVRRSIGVELSSTRHQVARDLLAASAATLSSSRKALGIKAKPGSPEPVSLVREDCAAKHLWASDNLRGVADTSRGGERGGERGGDGHSHAGALSEATVVYICNVMFDEELVGRIVSARHVGHARTHSPF